MKLHVEGFGCQMDGYDWFVSTPVRNLKREATEDMKALRQIIAEHKKLQAENARLREVNKALAGGFKRDLAHKLQQQTVKNRRLKEQLAAAQADAERYRWLREACGYVEDGSSTSVTIGQDDATRDWIVRNGPVGSKHWWNGRSLDAAIDDAIAKEQS